MWGHGPWLAAKVRFNATMCLCAVSLDADFRQRAITSHSAAHGTMTVHRLQEFARRMGLRCCSNPEPEP